MRYVLCLDGRIVGVVEAKKLTLGPQDVLTQAQRYSRGLTSSLMNYDGHRAPFLYSTNGERIWFHDVRHKLSRSRKVNQFHTPAALRELLEHDLDTATNWLETHANDHPEGMADISRGQAQRSPRTRIGYNSGTPAGCGTICPQRISAFMYTSSLAPRIGNRLSLTNGEIVCTRFLEAHSEQPDVFRNASEVHPIMFIY